MLETGTSGLMSGEGKPPAASRSRSSALPRLYEIGAQPYSRAQRTKSIFSDRLGFTGTTGYTSGSWMAIAPARPEQCEKGSDAHRRTRRPDKLSNVRSITPKALFGLLLNYLESKIKFAYGSCEAVVQPKSRDVVLSKATEATIYGF